MCILVAVISRLEAAECLLCRVLSGSGYNLRIYKPAPVVCIWEENSCVDIFTEHMITDVFVIAQSPCLCLLSNMMTPRWFEVHFSARRDNFPHSKHQKE